MITVGTLNRGIHSWQSASAQNCAEISFRGIASGHHMNRSMIMRQYLNQCESQKGLIKSIWMDGNAWWIEELLSLSSAVLHFRHEMQYLAQKLIYLFMDGQKNLAMTNRCWNTERKSTGICGLVPLSEISQCILDVDPKIGDSVDVYLELVLTIWRIASSRLRENQRW